MLYFGIANEIKLKKKKDMVAKALGNTLVDVKGEELVEELVQTLGKCVA